MLWTQARELYAEIGIPHRVEMLQGWLDGLPGDRSHAAPLTADEAEQLLAETRGAWGHQSLTQVDALLAERRRADWEDE